MPQKAFKLLRKPQPRSLTCLRKMGGPHPGFPVKFVCVDELHAAFPNESRTRGRCLEPRTENPGISLVFREMWDTTALNRQLLAAQCAFRGQVRARVKAPVAEYAWSTRSRPPP